MRYLLYLILSLTLLNSCKKEEPIIVEANNSIADDLKLIIAQEKIDALGQCCVKCICTQSMGLGKDYSFPGDNFVRIGNMTYNLNKLEYYTIWTFVTAPDT
jgi:hypothetical protein